MNPIFRNLFVMAIASASLLAGAAHAAEPVSVALPVPVTASFSILGDLVRVVGGERVRVTTLVGPDEDAHAFAPKPADARAIVQTRLLVTNGLGFEPWAQKLAKSAGYQGATLVASQGVKPRRMPEEKGHDHSGHDNNHQHDETDPHAWQNPDNVVLYVRNIATALGKADPAGSAIYQANSAAYVKEL